MENPSIFGLDSTSLLSTKTGCFSSRLVAFSQDIKAIRAGFAAGINSAIRLRIVSSDRRRRVRSCRAVFGLQPWGYRVDAHRLGFGSVHALFTCRQPGFLPNDSDDALWQELKQERFTTPLLRSWLPHIRKELETQEPARPLSHPRLHLLCPDRHVRRPGLDRRVRAQERLDLDRGGNCLTYIRANLPAPGAAKHISTNHPFKLLHPTTSPTQPTRSRFHQPVISRPLQIAFIVPIASRSGTEQ